MLDLIYKSAVTELRYWLTYDIIFCFLQNESLALDNVSSSSSNRTLLFLYVESITASMIRKLFLPLDKSWYAKWIESKGIHYAYIT